MKLIAIDDRAAWDKYVAASVWGHPLQLWGWGELKRENGWTPHRLALVDDKGGWMAAAQVLLWPIPRTGRVIAYVPRGPVAEPGSKTAGELLRLVTEWARGQKAIYVRVEPAWLQAKMPRGWRRTGAGLQMSATYTIDLAKTEDELLEAMARKHRQYVRKAEREGVTVERVDAEYAGADSLAEMYRIYSETAARAKFGLHAVGYYQTLLRELGEANYLCYARADGRVVAFLWLAAAGQTAYELYGGVDAAGQEAHANYLLKWVAMRELKAAGYKIYDFNGRLNEGVSQFKVGFGPDKTDFVGTWDYPLNKFGYQLWQQLWPAAKLVGRRLAKLRRAAK
jgi:lipid II:glycine glycyltransferase (peptidoglycan interpeptide bridge formation enzyme)